MSCQGVPFRDTCLTPLTFWLRGVPDSPPCTRLCMSREQCPYQDARAFQYAFVAGVLRVEYLKEALQQRRPALQGVAPFVTIHVTTREGCDDRAMTECGMHHFPVHVWSHPHSDVLRDPVVLRPFCVFGSASSCLLIDASVYVGTVHVTDVAHLTDSFRESALSALELMNERNPGRTHRGYKRKVNLVMSILSTATNTANWTSKKLKSLAEVIPGMIDIPAVVPFRPGFRNVGLPNLIPRSQVQVALKAAVEAVHTSSLTYGGVVVLGDDDSGKKKTTHILIDNSRFPEEAFIHKHRVAAIASATTYAAWQKWNLPSGTFASVASYRLIVRQGIGNVVVSPPLDDLVDVHGIRLDPAKDHHAVMMLVGNVHDHVHIVAALGRASSALIPKLIGTSTDDSNDIAVLSHLAKEAALLELTLALGKGIAQHEERSSSMSSSTASRFEASEESRVDRQLQLTWRRPHTISCLPRRAS